MRLRSMLQKSLQSIRMQYGFYNSLLKWLKILIINRDILKWNFNYIIIYSADEGTFVKVIQIWDWVRLHIYEVDSNTYTPTLKLTMYILSFVHGFAGLGISQVHWTFKPHLVNHCNLMQSLFTRWHKTCNKALYLNEIEIMCFGF